MILLIMLLGYRTEVVFKPGNGIVQELRNILQQKRAIKAELLLKDSLPSAVHFLFE